MSSRMTFPPDPSEPGDLGPQIQSVTPSPATPGAQITISGIRFGVRTAASKVRVQPAGLAAVDAAIVSWNATRVVAQVPAIAQLVAGGLAEITLVAGAGAADFPGFVVHETSPPAITELSRPTALPGDELRIGGRGFGTAGTPGGELRIGGRAVQVLAWTPTAVRARVPDRAQLAALGPTPVALKLPWGAATATLTVAEPPTITAVTPALAAPDTAVTIGGRGFGRFEAGASAVVRGTDPVSGRSIEQPMEVDAWTPDQIRAFVPGLALLGPSGAKHVVVRTALGDSAPAALQVADMASVTSWTRIEPHARSTDVAEGMRRGLRAELADPLWLLGRQWLLGELRGEDAGSPVVAQLEGELCSVSRWRSGDDPAAVAALPAGVPLETLVERERVMPQRPGAGPFADHRLAVEAGLQFLRILAARVGDATRAAAYRRAFVAAFPVTAGAAAPDPRRDGDGARFVAVAAGRLPDGARLHEALGGALPPERGGRGQLPAQPPVQPADREAVLGAVADWYSWCERFVSQPDGGRGAWDPERLEHRFAVSADTSEGEAVMAVSEYADGRLDWPAFAHAPGSLGAPGGQRGKPPVPLRRAAVPMPVAYPGMPAPRWWTMEDAQVDFGAVDAGPTDLARLLLVEFATLFSNDWFVLPVGGVPPGSLVRVGALRVRDTFGEEATVAPFRETGPGGTWRMFCLAAADGRDTRDTLLLAPTVAGTTEGAAVEEVVFLRDELANLAWAVERTVAGATGGPLRRQESETDSPATEPPAGGDLAYRLMTDVPAHWIPLVRETTGGSPRLERAALRRPGPGGDLAPVLPAGRILEPDRPQLRIHDAEVPRQGAAVTRAWQLARGPDGETHLWIGRRKGPAGREGSSGLRFDVVEPADAPVR